MALREATAVQPGTGAFGRGPLGRTRRSGEVRCSVNSPVLSGETADLGDFCPTEMAVSSGPTQIDFILQVLIYAKDVGEI